MDLQKWFAKELTPSAEPLSTSLQRFYSTKVMESQSTGGPLASWCMRCSQVIHHFRMKIQWTSTGRLLIPSHDTLKDSIRKLRKITIRKCKSLIKHLLRRDLSKRYGNLKNGAEDVKNHKFFENFQWTQLLAKKLDVPFVPKCDS